MAQSNESRIITQADLKAFLEARELDQIEREERLSMSENRRIYNDITGFLGWRRCTNDCTGLLV
jgi:hypothetical protein